MPDEVWSTMLAGKKPKIVTAPEPKFQMDL
jgi:hypothetical protein